MKEGKNEGRKVRKNEGRKEGMKGRKEGRKERKKKKKKKARGSIIVNMATLGYVSPKSTSHTADSGARVRFLRYWKKNI